LLTALHGAKWFAILVAFAAFGLAAAPARADSMELEVYRSDLTDKGETNVDFAANLARSPLQGDGNGRSVFQAVGEFSYGLSDNLQLGLKLPLAYTNAAWYGTGLLTELKYVAPHEGGGLYWGVEFEAGYLAPLGEARQWALEATPIVGYRANGWELVANPGLSIASAGDQRGVVAFEPSGKVAYQVAKQCALGVEYFSEAGALRSMLAGGKRNEIAFLTVDTKIGKSTVNLGIGHGTNDASPGFVAKLVVDLEFD
jgi:hypothetical protein